MALFGSSKRFLRPTLIVATLISGMMIVVATQDPVSNQTQSLNVSSLPTEATATATFTIANSAALARRSSGRTLIQPSLLMDYNQVIINHNKKASLAKPKQSISYNQTRSINKSSGANNTASQGTKTQTIRYSPRKIDQLVNKAALFNPQEVASKNTIGQVETNSTTGSDQLVKRSSSSSSSTSPSSLALHDSWPKKFKDELEYFRTMGDPLQTNMRPRWSNPCSSVHRFKTTITTGLGQVTTSNNSNDNDNKVLHNNSGVTQRRKRRSITRQKPRKIYTYIGQAGKIQTFGANGRPKKRIKKLHGSSGQDSIEPGSKVMAPKRHNTTMAVLLRTKEELMGILRSVYIRTGTIRDMSTDLKDKLIDEYFGVREDFERDMEPYRQPWLPRVKSLLSSQRSFAEMRDSFNVAKDYLQYFAVGFEQSILDQMEIGDVHLLDFMKIESSVLDLLCSINGVIRLNHLHHHQQLKIRPQGVTLGQGNVTNADATNNINNTSNNTNTSTDTRTGAYNNSVGKETTSYNSLIQVDEDHSYIKRSVMDVRQRREKQRAHRYVRDYMIVRDYITLIDYIKTLVTDLVTELIKSESFARTPTPTPTPTPTEAPTPTPTSTPTLDTASSSSNNNNNNNNNSTSGGQQVSP